MTTPPLSAPVGPPLSPVLAEHLADLRRLYPGAELRALPDQSSLVTVPGVRLPAGWSQTETAVAFVVPPMYPVAPPDCFWADVGLRLATGGVPQNANVSPIPHVGEQRMWFSWHVQAWSPVVGSLLTFMRVVEERFRRGN